MDAVVLRLVRRVAFECVPLVLSCVRLVQMSHLTDRALSTESTKFVGQLKAKGMKHSEKLLRLQAKAAAREAKAAEKAMMKRVCVATECVALWRCATRGAHVGWQCGDGSAVVSP